MKDFIKNVTLITTVSALSAIAGLLLTEVAIVYDINNNKGEQVNALLQVLESNRRIKTVHRMTYDLNKVMENAETLKRLNEENNSTDPQKLN